MGGVGAVGGVVAVVVVVAVSVVVVVLVTPRVRWWWSPYGYLEHRVAPRTPCTVTLCSSSAPILGAIVRRDRDLNRITSDIRDRWILNRKNKISTSLKI